jgi:hypothetical protein
MNRCATNETRLTITDPQNAPQGTWTARSFPRNLQIHEDNHNKNAMITSINKPYMRPVVVIILSRIQKLHLHISEFNRVMLELIIY